LLLSLGCGGARWDPYEKQLKRVETLSLRGERWFSQGDFKRSERDFSRALKLSRSVDYSQGVAQQLNNLGALALEQGDLEKAKTLFTEAWEINGDLQYWREASINQANLATVAQKQGNREQVEAHLHTALREARWSGSSATLGQALIRWAGYYLDLGDTANSLSFLKEAQPLAVSPAVKGALHHEWGRYYLAQGNTSAAVAHFSKALKADKEILNRAAMAADLFSLGMTYQAQGLYTRAFSYYSRAFDTYAGLGKRSRLQSCLNRLRQVKAQGDLDLPLERFEKHPLLSSS
jgi:tetratricopeptide (TPR) repeat protein